ncbi:hypothetical protein [Roseateles sp. LYH14W]|uniref:Uncharacterized protein n=1 Tax=Pelomonas parva TaxID=3299032 RepID=A0ABW7EXZ7_9BURK
MTPHTTLTPPTVRQTPPQQPRPTPVPVVRSAVFCEPLPTWARAQGATISLAG